MNTEQEHLKGNLATLILAVLEQQPLHGYGIAREVQNLSSNALQLKEGALYPALHALERDRLLASDWQTLENGRQRKVYHITPDGRAALERSTRTWRAFVDAMQRVLEGAGATTPGAIDDVVAT